MEAADFILDEPESFRGAEVDAMTPAFSGFCFTIELVGVLCDPGLRREIKEGKRLVNDTNRENTKMIKDEMVNHFKKIMFVKKL